MTVYAPDDILDLGILKMKTNILKANNFPPVQLESDLGGIHSLLNIFLTNVKALLAKHLAHIDFNVWYTYHCSGIHVCVYVAANYWQSNPKPQSVRDPMQCRRGLEDIISPYSE